MIKFILYAKDPYQTKYQLLLNKQENVGLKHCNDSKAFIEYSNDVDDIYENIDDRSGWEKREIALARTCTRHIKNKCVILSTPKTWHGEFLHFFMTHSFSTLLITLFITALNKCSVFLYSTSLI